MAKLKVSKKTLLIITIAFLVIAGILFVTEKTNLTNFIKTSPPTQEEQVESTSKSPSAKADFTAEEPSKQAGDTRKENQSDANVVDRNGASPNSNTSNAIKSSTGEITVYTPAPNTVAKSIVEISGASSLPRVSYRLIDNVSGVVTTGELSVVNGKFAGTLSFSSSATEARLDIFGSKPDGTEFSNIEIPLRLN